MSPIVSFDAVGPRAEELANGAAANRDVVVGFDPEFECFNFDADGISEQELAAVIAEELDNLEPDWRSHLSPVD